MREGIGRVGENERIVMIEIALRHEERESGKIARAGVVLHIDLACEPSLIVGNGAVLWSATRHHTESVGRGRLVYDVDAEFLDAVDEGTEEQVGLFDMVDIECKEA